MNAQENIIKKFYAMSPQTKASIVYGYHVKMRDRKGIPVQGRVTKGTHSVRQTAMDFGMSVGTAHGLIEIGRGLTEGE